MFTMHMWGEMTKIENLNAPFLCTFVGMVYNNIAAECCFTWVFDLISFSARRALYGVIAILVYDIKQLIEINYINTTLSN